MLLVGLVVARAMCVDGSKACDGAKWGVAGKVSPGPAMFSVRRVKLTAGRRRWCIVGEGVVVRGGQTGDKI